ncbi:MAG: hydroxyacid dehydrogenase [Anaerolineae bacterium]
MTRPKIYIHRVFSCTYDLYMDAENEALLASFADVINHGNRSEPVSAEELRACLPGVRGILSLNGSGASDLSAELVKEAGTIEVAAIAHWWHGSHNTAVQAWRGAGVACVDASDACNEAVAEWAVGAIICGLRRFEHFDREMKRGVLWPERLGVAGQLCGATVGLVGLGRVGRLAATFLRPFPARVLGYDPFVTPEVTADLGVEQVGLDTLLRQSDAVSLHLAVTPATTGIIGRRELSFMKDGALLVNSGRAALLDNAALRDELSSGRLRAYLDVFEPEPPPLDDVLRRLDNVVLTPHVAGHTSLMFKRCGQRAIEALQKYLVAG